MPYVRHSLGMMQGRLVPPTGGRIQSFPRERWREEFAIAQSLGYDSIELTIEEASIHSHPIRSAEGRRELRHLAERHDVRLAGLVLDIVMEWPLAGADDDLRQKGEAMVGQLLEDSAALGLPMLELPMMGANSLAKSPALDKFDAVLARLLDKAQELGIDILMEVDTDAVATAAFLDVHPHPRLGINYDCGNSTWFGFDPAAEIPAYGHRIRNVHIKDCTRADYSVPLGRGETRFDIVMSGLAAVGYQGGFILQAARQDDDVAAARDYFAFSRALIERLS